MNDRLANQNHRINRELKEGEITKQQSNYSGICLAERALDNGEFLAALRYGASAHVWGSLSGSPPGNQENGHTPPGAAASVQRFSTQAAMTARTRIVLTLVAVGILLGFKGKDASLLWSFERPAELQSIQTSHVAITRIKQSPGAGHYALRLDFGAVERPQIEFSAADVRTDWRPFGALALDASNPSADPIGFSMEVEDETGATIAARTKWDLGPHESASYALDPLAVHYGVSHEAPPIGLKIRLVQGRTFRFYSANLARKYGHDWPGRWRAITLARLRAWGFNTIGNWSDPQLYEEDRIPYTATLEVQGATADVPGGGDYWRRMVDPFDPAFSEAVNLSVQRGAGCAKDSWCLGYFVDNELSWGTGKDERSRYGLALGTLTLGASSPAKLAFVDQLQKRYASIEEFNNAWNSHLSDWRHLLEGPFQSDSNFTEAMREDMRTFLRTLARRYFQTVRDALKKYDPNHLYLGSRFSSYTPESLEACAELCDVVSFNIYQPRVEPAEWQFLDSLGKPAIIGEFHMGATDRGMFSPGLVSTPNQSARAASFMDYVRSVVDNPVFVGCHYFEYNDEPLTGRYFDGENYAIGFTNVVDGLYPEMIAAARVVGTEMYYRRDQ